jgi:hypothetical protein
MENSQLELEQNADSIEMLSMTTSSSHEHKQIAHRGRPKTHEEGWSKATVILLDRQIHWLDRLCADIRYNTKSAISRAEVIRAMISAIEESGLDFSEKASEKEIKEVIFRLLKNSIKKEH